METFTFFRLCSLAPLTVIFLIVLEAGIIVLLTDDAS